MVEEAYELVRELTNMIPQLRGVLTNAIEAMEATNADEDKGEDEEGE